MENDGLVSILGNRIRARIVRLAVTNPGMVLDRSEVARILRARPPAFNKELRALIKEGIITQKRVARSAGKIFKTSDGFILNPRYPFIHPLKRLVRETFPYDGVSLFRGLSKMRGMQVVIATGVFTDNPHTKIDVLAVGNDMDEKNIVNALSDIEQECGLELRYDVLNSNDFVYRLSVGDKMLRNIFDYPHNVYLDSLGIIKDYTL